MPPTAPLDYVLHCPLPAPAVTRKNSHVEFPMWISHVGRAAGRRRNGGLDSEDSSCAASSARSNTKTWYHTIRNSPDQVEHFHRDVQIEFRERTHVLLVSRRGGAGGNQLLWATLSQMPLRLHPLSRRTGARMQLEEMSCSRSASLALTAAAKRR